jgi:hypothetical protein
MNSEHNSEAGKNKWDGVLRGAYESQNYLQKDP